MPEKVGLCYPGPEKLVPDNMDLLSTCRVDLLNRQAAIVQYSIDVHCPDLLHCSFIDEARSRRYGSGDNRHTHLGHLQCLLCLGAGGHAFV